ncbi:hypothetical protein [Arenibaculum pallidiluteum]|uniref:hypothetical protein n=1 Tax=Arenibaculum pallidiluteum TaxID=2812559 RepID=UPI001A95C7BD|nr:hypothetical protein [Arenibaculum pallidiluteum]
MQSGRESSGIKPILSVRLADGERLLIARLSNAGASSQSNRFVLRRSDLRPPWEQPEKGYFGYADVARALIANGWRAAIVEIMPTADPEENRIRHLGRRKLHAFLVQAAIDRERTD